MVRIDSEAELENGLVGDVRRGSAEREPDGATAICKTTTEEGVVEVRRLEVAHIVHVYGLQSGEHVDELCVTVTHAAGDLIQGQCRCWVDIESERLIQLPSFL